MTHASRLAALDAHMHAEPTTTPDAAALDAAWVAWRRADIALLASARPARTVTVAARYADRRVPGGAPITGTLALLIASRVADLDAAEYSAWSAWCAVSGDAFGA